MIVIGKGEEEREVVLTPRGGYPDQHILNQLRDFTRGHENTVFSDGPYQLRDWAWEISCLVTSFPETESREQRRSYGWEWWKILQAEGKIPTIKVMIMAQTAHQTSHQPSRLKHSVEGTGSIFG